MDDTDIANRFNFHPAAAEEKRNAHTSARNACHDAANALNRLCPDGREKSLAITHLEEAMFWANAALARNQAQSAPAEPDPPATGQLTSYLLTEPKSCSRTHDCAGAEACNGTPRLPRPAPARGRAGQ